MTTLDRYCSNCFDYCEFELAEINVVRDNRYRCSGCDKLGVTCTAIGCQAMALAGDEMKVANVFCAEHRGDIRNFETVNDSIDNLAQYEMLMERRVRNMDKIGKKALIGGASAVAVFVTAGAAAPAIAANLGALGLLGAAGTGTAISTLSGAALTSASLAALGGTMAGGVAIVAAVGGAFGASKGGAISQGYFGEVEPFRIREIRAGHRNKPAIVYVNGFMSDLRKNRAEWMQLLDEEYPNNQVFEVEWESKRLHDCFQMLTDTTPGGMDKLLRYGKAGARGLMGVVTVLGLMDNPFHQAMVKAQMAGVMLADAIGRTPVRRKYIMMGHSLGARVCFFSMLNLAQSADNRKAGGRLSSVHLFGGAVGTEPPDEWKLSATAVSQTIHNYLSLNDDVLRVAYRASLLYRSEPIGRHAIDGGRKIVNVEVTEHVGGHTKYIENAVQFIRPDSARSRTGKRKDRVDPRDEVNCPYCGADWYVAPGFEYQCDPSEGGCGESFDY